MNIVTYKEQTKRTLPDLGLDKETQTIRQLDEIIGNKLNLSHMVLGLSGEVGELVNCIGTEMKNSIDKANLIEELGDLWWYFSNYCNIRNRPIPEDARFIIETELALELLIINIADLCDIVKRFIAYGKEINVTKELDILYNISAALGTLEEIYGVSGGEVRQRNIDKLQVRYPQKFTENLANNRNLSEERKTLE